MLYSSVSNIKINTFKFITGANLDIFFEISMLSTFGRMMHKTPFAAPAQLSVTVR
jgi:hypothetical protein